MCCPRFHLGVRCDNGKNIPDCKWSFMGHYGEQSLDLISLLVMESCDKDMGECFIVILQWLCFHLCIQKILLPQNIIYCVLCVHQEGECNHGYCTYGWYGHMGIQIGLSSILVGYDIAVSIFLLKYLGLDPCLLLLWRRCYIANFLLKINGLWKGMFPVLCHVTSISISLPCC